MSTENRLLRLAWLMWGIAILAQWLNLFQRVAGATVADRLMAEFDISATALGVLMSVLFYVYGLMQFPVGAMADSLGPRKILSVGILTASIGSVVFGLAPSLPFLFMGRFLISLGVSVVFVSAMKVAADWFPSRHFGFMSTFTVFISQAGSLVATTPLALLVTWVGWRKSFELMGLLSLGVCLVIWLALKDRPGDLGLALVEPGPGDVTKPAGPTLTTGQRVKLVLTNPHTWPPFVAAGGLYGTLLVLLGAWGIPYLMQVYNMTRSDAANYMLVASVGMMVGSLAVAQLSDRVMQRRRTPAVICNAGYLALWLILTFWNAGRLPPAILGTICFLMGFFCGYQGLFFACVKEVTPAFAAGTAIGVVNISPFLTPAILQPLFGWVLDLGWQGATVEGARIYPLAAFHTAFLLICATAAIATVGAFFIKETRCRNLIG
ncbi:MAG: MFS transporter [Chloroflexota bacterium]|nr:MFS transporter [Chloroflexota bacterium]